MPGDIVFALGGVTLGLFALRLPIGRRKPTPVGTTIPQRS